MPDSNAAKTTAPPQVTEILTPAQVEALVCGYAAQPTVLADFAAGALSAHYAPGGTVFTPFVDQFYVNREGKPPPTSLSARDRELVVIALFAAMNVPNALLVHLYWAIGEGVPVKDLAEVLLLTGGYAGTAAYVNPIAMLSKMLTALSTLFTGPPPYAPITPQAALKAITTG